MRYCALFLLLFFVFPSAVLSGFPDPEEVLVFVPSGIAAPFARHSGSDLRFYHRFPDGYLAGVRRSTLSLLQRASAGVQVIDETGWSSTYAVVTGMGPLEAMPASMACAVEVLRRWGDLQLIRGGEPCLDQLRDRGFAVVGIERVPIPVSAQTTRFSGDLPRATLGGIDTILTRVSASSISGYIQGMQNFGTRMWSNANRDSVSRWLAKKYQQLGFSDVRLDSFQYNGTWQTNVVATLAGSPGETGEIIVGGHLDSYSSNPANAPGADDNASGAVAALEMARALKSTRYHPALTIRFMGFAAEEAGLKGSASYAQRARATGRNIKAMLNYDMIANRTASQGDRDVYVVWYTGGEALQQLHSAMMRTYTTLNPVSTTSHRSGSDSYSFWQQNYPSVFCIERDFSPYYHSPGDLLQYLDMDYAAEIVKSGLATVLVLDEIPPTVTGLQVRDRGDGASVLVTWDSAAVSDFDAYRVSIGTSPGSPTATYDQSARSRLLTGLTAGVTYYVGVSVLDLAGRQGITTEEAVVPALVPVPPAGLTAQHLGTSIRLLWSGNREIDLLGYNVYRSTPSMAFTRLNAEPIRDTTWTDAAAEGTYFVTAIDSAVQESESSDTVQVFLPRYYPVQAGWNIISVPLAVSDPARTTLFPLAVSNAVTYDSGYVSHALLERGKGYWLKFTGAQDVPLSGLPVAQETVAVAAGWNMVGALSRPIAAGAVITEPAEILDGRFYGFGPQGYTAADSLRPGRGYWVKSIEPGVLVLPGSGP